MFNNRKLAGIFLVALPFVIVFIGCWYSIGAKAAFSIFSGVGFIVLCMNFGLRILMED